MLKELLRLRFFRDPENRLKRSIAMKGVKFYCSKCGQEGHRRFYCPTVREVSARVQFRCRLCGERGIIAEHVETQSQRMNISGNLGTAANAVKYR
eukprot:UN17276